MSTKTPTWLDDYGNHTLIRITPYFAAGLQGEWLESSRQAIRSTCGVLALGGDNVMSGVSIKCKTASTGGALPDHFPSAGSIA